MWWQASVIPALLLQDGKQRQENCPDAHEPTSLNLQHHKNKMDPPPRGWEARTDSPKLSSDPHMYTFMMMTINKC